MADDLWRHCAAWLTKCKVIPSDHKANAPDSEIRVLALTLRDGVLLCNLLNFIDPNALDMKDFNRKPQMAQVCAFLFRWKSVDATMLLPAEETAFPIREAAKRASGMRMRIRFAFIGTHNEPDAR